MELDPSKSDNSTDIDLYLSINGINNLDYISNVFNIQLTIIELWKDGNITDDFLEDKDLQISLIKESKFSFIQIAYPNLLLDESVYLDNLNNFNRKQFYYFKDKNILIKKSILHLQIRCMISIQTYPFIESPCYLSFLTSPELKNELNYTICNLNSLLNREFTFNKVTGSYIIVLMFINARSIFSRSNFDDSISECRRSNFKSFLYFTV